MTKEELARGLAIQELDYLRQSYILNEFCLEHGCFFDTMYLRGFELEQIQEYRKAVLAGTEPDDRGTVYSRINNFYTRYCYYANYRAFMLKRATRLPFLRGYAHYLERATISYYKGDFFSTVLILLPAADAVLRKYAGWRLNGPTVRYPDIGDRIMGRPITRDAFRAARSAMFRFFLLQFLNRWFFIHTSKADFTTSFLNRHIGAHAGERQQRFLMDCNQMFALIDIVIEAIGHDSNRAIYGFIPTNIPEINTRASYYTVLMAAISDPQREFENSLMRRHPNFEVEPRPNWLKLQAEVEAELQEKLRRITEGFKAGKEKPPTA